MATPSSVLLESCCTCATLLPDPSTTHAPSYDFSDEQKRPPTPPPDPPRRLDCCNRLICAPCQSRNPRFESYCPFCQISSKPTALPQGLKDPPTYEEDGAIISSKLKRQSHGRDQDGLVVRPDVRDGDELPAYTPAPLHASQASSSQQQQAPDTTHHLHPSDTLSSLSLAYNIPPAVLRTHNALFSDSLLAARRTILIPGSHYQGPSLSDKPVESEEERIWKGRLRRFMVRSKCASYEVAEVYLKGAISSIEKSGARGSNEEGEDEATEVDSGKTDAVVEEAVKRWEEDERWEREHPLAKEKGKQDGRKRRGFGGSLAGQLR